MYDEICQVLEQNGEWKKLLKDHWTESCWPDTRIRTLTSDVGAYISQQGDGGLGEDELDLSEKDWMKLFEDKDVFVPASFVILERMKDFGGRRSFNQLADKYGGTQDFYAKESLALAHRIADKLGCHMKMDERGKEILWPILYDRAYSDTEPQGGYIWKLKEELTKALDQADKSAGEDSGKGSSEPAAEEILSAGNGHSYTRKDFLSEVYMEPGQYDRMRFTLLNKKNIILQGAPGVGKTFAAKRLAYSIMGEKDEDRIEFIQFHQSYAYEDFVMGYKPSGDGFELKYGVFYRFCQKAAKDPDRDYFFIIDEINRGNISKILGELLMLIERDHRGEEITLAYNGEPFSVPERLYIIGMMNTTDRSLARIDYALRRRFSFFEMNPAFELAAFQNDQKALHNKKLDKLIEEIKKLNQEIRKDKSLGKGFCIGHSYFCGCKRPGDCTDAWLQSIVDYDILPMLEEY